MDSDSFNSILLPAFVEHRAPPPFNLPPIIVPFASSTSNLLDTPPPSPRSAAAKFFSRTRTTSLHSNALPLALSNKPVPPLPLNLSSTPASFEPETSLSLIKSISVPHHSKLGGKWMWACRVVPEIATGDKLSSSAPLMHRQGSLGKMEMAVDNDGGPYTVWRKWEEFVDFSTRLAVTFPIVPPEPWTSSSTYSTSTEQLPSSFYRHTPRLSKKLTLFVTRNTLLQREEELNLFVRRLFEMPSLVRDSILVRTFFSMRPSDNTSPSPGSAVASLPTTDVDAFDPDSFAHFLASRQPSASSPRTKSPAPSSSGRAFRRPRLGLKFSTPDLRKLAVDRDEESDDLGVRLPMSGRTVTPASSVQKKRTSISTSSISSSNTIIAPNQSTRVASPLLRHVNSSSPLPATPIVTAKRPGAILRHFQSLQDLRHHINVSPTSTPPPVPYSPYSTDSVIHPTSAPMTRGFTSPNSFTPSSPHSQTLSNNLSRSYNGPISAPGRSRPSSGSSFEDGPSPMQYYDLATSFRQNASGRLTNVPSFLPPSQRQRRPSIPRRLSSTTSSHSSSRSVSSLDSIRSSGGSIDLTRSTSAGVIGACPSAGMGGSRSRRSSTDYSSDNSQFFPATPPTPQSTIEEFGQSLGKYYVDELGLLLQNNIVPLPPFFPVPPSMSPSLQQSFSDSPSPRVRRSSGSRSRTTSSASIRSPLDTILASPRLASTTPSPVSPNPATALSSSTSSSINSTTINCKVLHALTSTNFLLKISRRITLVGLRVLLEEKFAASAIDLAITGSPIVTGGDRNETSASNNPTRRWQLVYSSSGGDSEFIDEEEDLTRVMESSLEKITLRIV